MVGWEVGRYGGEMGVVVVDLVLKWGEVISRGGVRYGGEVRCSGRYGSEMDGGGYGERICEIVTVLKWDTAICMVMIMYVVEEMVVKECTMVTMVVSNDRYGGDEQWDDRNADVAMRNGWHDIAATYYIMTTMRRMYSEY